MEATAALFTVTMCISVTMWMNQSPFLARVFILIGILQGKTLCSMCMDFLVLLDIHFASLVTTHSR